MQFDIFSAKLPWTFPPHSVPAIAQQHLPALSPPLIPWVLVSVAARHMPNSLVLSPPGWRPHFLISQQLSFFVISPSYLVFRFLFNNRLYVRIARNSSIASDLKGRSIHRANHKGTLRQKATCPLHEQFIAACLKKKTASLLLCFVAVIYS